MQVVSDWISADGVSFVEVVCWCNSLSDELLSSVKDFRCLLRLFSCFVGTGISDAGNGVPVISLNYIICININKISNNINKIIVRNTLKL